MHVEEIRFDEVFDVAAAHGNFSFRSRDRTEYGVRLRRHAIPRAGSTFAIAFAQPGNWNSVLGWRDLAAQKVMLTQPAWTSWLFGLSDIVLFGVFFIVPGLLLWGAGGALAVTAALAAVACFRGLRLMRRNQAVKQALLAAGEVEGQACASAPPVGQ